MPPRRKMLLGGHREFISAKAMGHSNVHSSLRRAFGLHLRSHLEIGPRPIKNREFRRIASAEALMHETDSDQEFT